MVGLEDSVHPTVKKLRSAFRFPSLTTSGWLAIVKFGSEMVGQARFVLARGSAGSLGGRSTGQLQIIHLGVTMTKADLKNFQQQLLDLRTRLNGDVSHLTD